MMNRFDEWNSIKKDIHLLNIENFYVNQREIWYVRMGKNIGFEEDGKGEFLRPVLVLKKIGNLFLTVALTSKGKDDHFLYHKFEEVEFEEKHKKYYNSSYAILSQVKVMDKKRFTQKMGIISEKEFFTIQKNSKHCYFESLVTSCKKTGEIPKDICTIILSNL